MKGKGECIFGSGFGRVPGEVNGRAREGIALLLSKHVLEGVEEYREVSARLMSVKVKFEGEFCFFVNEYGPQCERIEEERGHFGVNW